MSTNVRRFRFHCCSCSFGINQGALSLPECPSLSDVDSWVVKSSSSNNIDEYLSSKGLHRPKSESFKCPFLSSMRLSGFMSLQAVSAKVRISFYVLVEITRCRYSCAYKNVLLQSHVVKSTYVEKEQK